MAIGYFPEGARRFFRGKSRSEIRASKNLGVVDKTHEFDSTGVFRSPELERLDAYYERRQYAQLPKWSDMEGPNGEFVPVRCRAPRFNYPYSKNLSQRVGAKLVGKSVFPTLKIEDSPNDQAFFAAIIKQAKLRARLQEPIRRLVNTGSVFVRFYIQEGAYKVEWYHSKYCYPMFRGNGELLMVRIQYVYTDSDDKDTNGNPKRKWYRMDVGADEEILYDNPEYKVNEEPQFQAVASVETGMGFVQGEWFRTCESLYSPDGYSVIGDVLEFVDELNYSLSQSSTAVGYNQDPQLVFNKMTEEETEAVIRSATKSWNLGREGEAKFVESTLNGVQRAMELRDKIRSNIGELTRVIIHDPEKIVGNAQSAKAMEVLHGPLLDLIDELREPVGDSLNKLVQKMAVATEIAASQGVQIPLEVPPGYGIQSLNSEVDWPPIFQETMDDLQKKVQVANSAKTGGLIAPDTAARFVQKDFGVEDVDAELAKVAEEQKAQAALNPYGGF